MKPLLYAHPFASYCQKVLIALYENDTPFSYRKLVPEDPSAMRELEKLWPLKKFPVLLDDGQVFLESSIIIEYLAIRYPGRVRLIPADAPSALEVRMMDRFFDNYVMTPMQKIVADFIRAKADRDPLGIEEARSALDSAYGWLNRVMEKRVWAAGAEFSMADCAAGPSLFYSDWVHEIGEQFGHLRAFRKRLLARPSVARAVEEARPYRKFFPPGAPDRD
ncbi:MAG: glutathione S-transferase family protein [Pseudomonadota bacterium]|nr:glutathione S-transferase family protein [Pseudomonadota bacterium]